jgi:hypothetical protein
MQRCVVGASVLAALALATAAAAQVRIGVTVSATGPAASLGAPPTTSAWTRVHA